MNYQVRLEVLLLKNENEIVPIILTDSSKTHSLSAVKKPKVACRLKTDNTEVFIYNGVNQYILTSILKEFRHVN